MYFTKKTITKLLTQTLKTRQYAKIRPLDTTPTSNVDSINYCAQIVKSHDYENFLATLLMTKALRSPTLVVRAFNVEIARVQDQTTDPQIAMMRMQFWHDTLKDIYKKDQTLNQVPANPVAQELFKICNVYKLPKRNLQKLIDSRQMLMKAKYFGSLADLEKYTDDSVSAIYYTILWMAGVQSLHADHAASHLGKAQGLTNMLRSIPMSSHYKMVYVPMDLLMKHNISQEDVLRCQDSENMRNCTYEIAISANNHLKKARKIGGVPKLANQIFLPAVAINNYLKKLQKCNFNVFDSSLVHRSATLPIIYYFMRLCNRY
ncbi:NADH dehydrogenase (ubiquinone) complex I, assembly factor 6 isoform X1 [Leguminivora glycinivorella]|uniref:NADH dehydrogenase (ubiquinone) complex I, assembly factor 6 isoform X1 n=2 Tax=Leguminivora glycinivorella TaxID=1035111 RepID=UPI00200DD9B4|nr:NADH dehydrogenase (ubiquinone) complex I, assembly factor 6 isoform X1 [Leguminivora glycinivorella]